MSLGWFVKIQRYDCTILYEMQTSTDELFSEVYIHDIPLISPFVIHLLAKILLLFFLYMVFHLRSQKTISTVKSLLGLFLGLLCVFFLNILRIVTLMLVGIRYPDFALTLFHGVIGSVYFLLFFLIFFPLLRRWIVVRKPRSRI